MYVHTDDCDDDMRDELLTSAGEIKCLSTANLHIFRWPEISYYSFVLWDEQFLCETLNNCRTRLIERPRFAEHWFHQQLFFCFIRINTIILHRENKNHVHQLTKCDGHYSHSYNNQWGRLNMRRKQFYCFVCNYNHVFIHVSSWYGVSTLSVWFFSIY